MTTLSIIICTYNTIGRLERTLDSIMRQKTTDYEVIIVDGASTDGTVDTIIRYEAAFGGRLRWVSESDRGLYHAMNKGVDMARGSHITVIGAGDWMEDDVLARVIDHIHADSESDAFYGTTRIWDAALQDSRVVWTFPDALPRHPMQHPALYYKKTLHNDFGAYDERYAIAADYLFCLKAFYIGRRRVVPIDLVVVNFVTDGRSSQHKYRSLWENYRVKKDVGISPGLWAEFVPQVKNKVMHLCQK